MQELFAGPEDQSGPFSEVQTTPVEAPLNSIASIRQSRLFALAKTDPSLSDILNDYNELQTRYERGIQASSEQQIRLEIEEEASQRRQSALRELQTTDYRVDPDGTLAAGAAAAYDRELQRNRERSAQVAAERAAAERLVDLAGTDPAQARVLYQLYERGNVIDQAIDYTAKSMIVARGLEKAQAELADQSWFRNVVDFGMGFLALKSSMGNTGNFDVEGYDGAIANAFSQVFSGGRLRGEVASLWSQDLETFAEKYESQYLPAVLNNSTLLGYTSNSQRADILSQMQSTRPVWETNAWNLLDNAGIVGGVMTVGGKMGLKATSSLAASAIRLGGRKTSSEIYANAAKVLASDTTAEAVNRAGVNSIDEVIDSMAPAAVRQEIQPLHAVSPQAMVNNILETTDKLMEKLPKWMQPGRFANEAELNEAIENFIAEESKKFDSRLVDHRSVAIRTADGSDFTAVEFTLGKVDGTGFARESSASNYAKSLNIGNARVIPAEDGTFFVQVRKAMPENGVYTNTLNVQTRSPVGRFLAGARNRSDRTLANAATRADHAHNRIINKVIPAISKNLNVDMMSRERLTNLWRAGDNEGVWWSRDQANSLYQRTYRRDISDKEWQAYETLRQINDIEYVIRNDLVWKEEVLRGMETVTMDLGPIGNLNRVNAFVDENLTRPLFGRIIHAKDGTIWDDVIPEDTMKALKDEGYVAVHLDEPAKDWLAGGNSTFDIVIVKKSDFKRDMLDRHQLSYRPGGHRFYDDAGGYYSKQTRVVMRADGTTRLAKPGTYITGTKAEVDEWNSYMERMRQAVKNDPQISASALDDIIDGRVGYPTGEDFLKGLKNGDYDLNHPFKTYFDREMPAEYHASPNPFIDAPESGTKSLMQSMGRMYYSKKGTVLKDYRGERSITLDPWKATNKALINIANMSSFSDYKIQAVHRWYNTFKPYLEPNPALKTPMQYFMHGKLNKLASQDKVVNAIEDQRAIVRRNLGHQTDADLRIQEMRRNIAEWVMGSDPSSVRHKASRKIVNFMEEHDPVAFMRGWAFDLKMGLFNPAQLLLQANTYAAITAIDPVGGLRGLQAVPLLRGYLSFKGEPGAFKKANRLKASMYGFDSPEEMDAFLESAARSGFFDINESHTMINSMGPNSSFNVTGNKVNDLRQMGRFFFNTGETLNRMVAYRAAWRSEWTKAGKDGKDFLNDRFVSNAIIGRAEDLTLGMSRTSQAWWQQGVASIPTQFWSYQVRMLEAMLSGVTGKGSLTKAEAWRLIGSQMLLYGAAGTPITAFLADLFAEKRGAAPELGTFEGFITRGALDAMWHALSGGSDMLISERLGTGSWLPDTIDDILGLGRYGEVPVADFLGGATYSITKDLVEDLGPILKYARAETGADMGHPFTERALESLAKNITTLSNINKAYMVYNYGLYKTNQGNTQFADLPRADALAILMLGAAPGQTQDVDAMMAFNKHETEAIEEAAKVVSRYRQDLFNHPERAEEITEEINLFMSMYDPETRRKILQKVYKVRDRSMYDSLVRRREERRQREVYQEGTE